MDDELLHALGRFQRDLDDLEVEETMSADERDSALDGAFAQLEPGREDAGEDTVPAVADLTERRRKSALVAMLGVTVAVAAAVALWWSGRAPTQEELPRIAAIPSYSITQLRAGDAAQRGETPAVSATSAVELSPSARLELVLTPATPMRDPVGVAIVARPDSGPSIIAIPTSGVQISEDGGVRLSGPLDGFVELSMGHWTLDLLVGPPASLPRDVSMLDRAPSPPLWRTLTVEVNIVAPDR